MRGANELRELVNEFLVQSQQGGPDDLSLLRQRLSILERIVYYLLLRERDETVSTRRMANRLDTDLALLQSFIRSVQGADSESNSDSA